MTIRLYIDEDATRSAMIDGLRARGIDVTTVYDARRRGYPDEEQLRYATEHERVLFSFNQKDYMALHKSFLEHDLSHAGIALAAQGRYGIGEQIRRLSALVKYVSAEQMINRVEFLSAWGNRSDYDLSD